MKENISIQSEVLLEIAEMKRIYSALESSLPKSGKVSLAVTSSVIGEGKTTIAAGLASLAANNNPKKRVLAVDMNWYAPGLHKHFGLSLIDAEKLKKGISLESLIQKTAIENLHVLTAVQTDAKAGGLNGAENAVSGELLLKAREVYDMVFIDTSKVFPLNRKMIDPISVAKNADGTILVVLTNKTAKHSVKRTRFALEAAGANILGVIVNQWKNPLS
ncbi:MAG: CpsD/CapB family tyrosine-protein kinase [Pseudomonadota bacterium]